MTTATRARPRTLESVTTRLQTAAGALYVTVSLGGDGRPFEVFGRLGKAGGFEHGVTELACRLISLHLRRGTPLAEVLGQCRGIQEMQPWPNVLPSGRRTWVLGLGDGIAQALAEHLHGEEEQR